MSIHDAAFPYVNRLVQDKEDDDSQYGLSKLDYTMIMIFPAIIAKSPSSWTTEEIMDEVKHFALAILKTANS